MSGFDSTKAFEAKGGQFPAESRQKSHSLALGELQQMHVRQQLQDDAIPKDRKSAAVASDDTANEGDIVGDDTGAGCVQLNLHLDAASTFTIKVLRAANLKDQTTTKGLCPFVTITFLPISEIGLSTRPKMFTSNPVWKEAFRIQNFDSGHFKEHLALKVSVLDKQAGGKNLLLGDATVVLRTLPLEKLRQARGYTMWKYLSTESQVAVQSLGSLHFTARFNSWRQRLTLKVANVENACIPACATVPTLYVQLVIVHNGKVIAQSRTPAVSGTFSPVFEHKFKVNLDKICLADCAIKFQLKQQVTSRTLEMRRASTAKTEKFFKDTVGVIAIGKLTQDKESRKIWKQLTTEKDVKVKAVLNFCPPPEVTDG